MKQGPKASFLLFFIFFIFAFFTSEKPLYAQINLPPGITEEVVITNTPEIPSPGDVVQIKLQSFTSNLDRSIITWTLDGIIQKQGAGEKELLIIAPPAGQQNTIDITITKENGQTLEETLTLAPAKIDLVYEAETYTPPFYKGRSLFSHQSVIKLAALSDFVENNTRLSDENILFTWERDGIVLSELSGLGKNTARFRGTIVSEPFSITVTAEAKNGALKARETISVDPVDTGILLYPNTPTNGISFENTLLGVEVSEAEEYGITAIPYFFSASSRDDSRLIYNWRQNGTAIRDRIAASDILITNSGKVKSGVSQITVSTEHIDRILQNGRIGIVLGILGENAIDISAINDSEPDVF